MRNKQPDFAPCPAQPEMSFFTPLNHGVLAESHVEADVMVLPASWLPIRTMPGKLIIIITHRL